jgi:hypothetical protein
MRNDRNDGKTGSGKLGKGEGKRSEAEREGDLKQKLKTIVCFDRNFFNDTP